MKSKILIEDGEVTFTFSPETDLERMCLAELGDEISISHRHRDIVLRRRHDIIRKISDTEEPVVAARLVESD